jgi:glucokinase
LESIAGGRSFEENFEAKTGLTLTGEQITDIARAGDLAALEAFQEVGLAVGEVLAQVDTALDLDTVVVGGGFGKTSDLWLDIAKNLYEQALVGSTSRKMLRIVTSQLGQNAQLLGAGALR